MYTLPLASHKFTSKLSQSKNNSTKLNISIPSLGVLGVWYIYINGLVPFGPPGNNTYDMTCLLSSSSTIQRHNISAVELGAN